MSARRDPFAVLGVPPDATPQEVNRAYRRLMRRYHPDTRITGEDDRLLTAVMTAYRELQQRAEIASEPPPRSTVVRPTERRADPPIQAGPVHWWPSPRQ